MKRYALFFLCFLLLTACSSAPAEETTAPEMVPSPVPETTAVPVTASSEQETIPTSPETVVELTEKEKTMLLKIGMAERGKEDCTECIALVMRVVLNRVESDQFEDSVRSVLFASGQFTPVANGGYSLAEPNQSCYDALDMVIHGWDESQGALYYEWCEGESWHSENLHLLFQHCDVRFYD